GDSGPLVARHVDQPEHAFSFAVLSLRTKPTPPAVRVDPARRRRGRLRGPDGARARRNHLHTLVWLAQVAALGVAGVLPHTQDLVRVLGKLLRRDQSEGVDTLAARQSGDLNALLAGAFVLGQLGIPVTWY
ncbi:MAG TPA: hypothetical protein VJY65_12940, partial [Chloroflexota bacterium]|nr:hypothetical protein [Chloroflexota bacterium]